VATFVAFLRGVNLGPAKKISMAELRSMAEDLGYDDVATYINSGNLIVRTGKKAATVERELSRAIGERFGHEVDVAVRSEAELKELLAKNPYPDGDPSQVTVAFMVKAPGAQAKERVAAVATDHEPVTFTGKDVYVNYTKGLGQSKLAQRFSDIVGVSSTIRNVRTIAKIIELCEK
jgi:uncharacterized protein (DUF1697 family)